MKLDLFTQVALRQDIPEYNLKKGDIATIIDYHSSSNSGEDGYSLEGFNLPENCAEIFITVGADQIELREGEKDVLLNQPDSNLVLQLNQLQDLRTIT